MINYHHIGGRNGTYPLPLKNGMLLSQFHLVLYDADVNCINQIEKSHGGKWGKVSVFPYCVGGETRRAAFNINFHPTTSSLYPFNEAFADYSYIINPIYGEYRLGDACRPINTVELDLYSFQEILNAENIASVDYLSLDVQGAEFDILQGSKERLQSECVGIELEVEFVELYSGQKKFADIHALLESMNFELIEIDNFGRCAPDMLPIGYRGLEQPLSAEAIYTKKLNKLVESGNVDLICKAALFNLLYKKLGMCLKYMNSAVELAGKERFSSDCIPLYQQFLWKLWSLYQKDRHLTFPSIAQLFSHEAFQVFYQHGKQTYLQRDHGLKNQIDRLSDYVDYLSRNEYSPVESLLIEYSLNTIAETVKKHRLYEVECLQKLKGQ